MHNTVSYFHRQDLYPLVSALNLGPIWKLFEAIVAYRVAIFAGKWLVGNTVGAGLGVYPCSENTKIDIFLNFGTTPGPEISAPGSLKNFMTRSRFFIIYGSWSILS